MKTGEGKHDEADKDTDNNHYAQDHHMLPTIHHWPLPPPSPPQLTVRFCNDIDSTENTVNGKMTEKRCDEYNDLLYRPHCDLSMTLI